MTVIPLTEKKPKVGLFAQVKNLALFKLPFGHLGGLAAVGAYFFITQLLHGQHTTIGSTGITFPDVKGTWDHLLDTSAANGGFVAVMSHPHWTTIRHLIRPLYEGVFGGLLYQFIAYNPFKVERKDEPPLLSKIAISLRFIPTMYRKVTPLQIVCLPLTITLFSLPGVAVGYGIDRGLRAILKTKSLAPTLSAHPSVVDKFYTASFDAKVIGLFASLFFARKAAKPVFDMIWRFFAQRRAARGKRCHWWHPEAYQALVRSYQGNRAAVRDEHSTAVHVLIPTTVLLVLGMAGLGYWVLRYVAG